MSHRSRLTSLSLFLFTSTSLLACHGGDEDAPRGDTSFAAMSAAQREDAIRIAAGGAAMIPAFLVFSAELDEQQYQCPTRVDDGLTVTFTGGCTTDEGTRYDGTMVVTNAPMFTDLFQDGRLDPAQPMRIVLDGFRAGDAVYDGTLDQTTPLPADGQRYTTVAGFTISEGVGIGDGDYSSTSTCTGGDAPDCTMSGFVDLAATGSFAIDGQALDLGDPPAGILTLRGADTLRVDFDAASAGCVPYTIDGVAAGEVCGTDDGGDGGTDDGDDGFPAFAVTGSGSGCTVVDGTTSIDFDAWIRGDATEVTARVLTASGLDETHALAEISYDAANDEHAWQTVVASPATGVSCDDELTLVITARDAAGATACMATGPEAAPFAAEGCTVW